MSAKDQRSFVETIPEKPATRVIVWSGGIEPPQHYYPCVFCENANPAVGVLVLFLEDGVALGSLQHMIMKAEGYLAVDNTRWQQASYAHIGLCNDHYEVGLKLQHRADTRGILDEEDIRSALSAGKSPGT